MVDLVYDAEGVTQRAVPDLDRAVQTGTYGKLFSAAACVASVRGGILHRAAYGHLRAPPPPQLVDAATLFDLASLTKPLATALLAMLLWSRQRLDIEAPVSTFLKDFRHPPFDKITVAMLLDHSSGLPATAPVWEKLRRPGTPSACAEIRARVAKVALVAQPGAKACYSDLGFLILGWILEVAGARPLDQLATETLFRPLGLQRELFFVRHQGPRPGGIQPRRRFAATEQCPSRAKLLQGEVHDPLAWHLGGVAGHAGLFGTAGAVWHLAEVLLECYHGRLNFFHSGALARFWTRSRHPQGTLRTLGWDTPTASNSAAGSRLSRQSVGHLGFTGTSLWIDPMHEIVGVLLTNAVYPNRDDKDLPLLRLRARVYDLIAAEAALGPPAAIAALEEIAEEE